MTTENNPHIALVLVAHGSRRSASNREVQELAERLGEANPAYDQVKAAFLELAEPSIPDGIGECIEQGADEVVVLPYFLSAGRHVVEDIPKEVDKARARHPQAQVRIAPYLGQAAELPEVLLGLAATR